MFEGIVLKTQPDRSIEWLHLRHDVGDVHGIFISFCSFGRASPNGVFAASHMAAAELGRVPVALLEDLKFLGYPRIDLPTTSLHSARKISVQVRRTVEAHSAVAAHCR